MKKIEVVNVGEDRVSLKKDLLGWRVINPPRNKDGSWNYFNLIIGSWSNLLTIVFFILIVLGFFYIYHHDTAEMQKVVSSPCDYCTTQQMNDVLISRIKARDEATRDYKINLSGLESSVAK